MFNKTVAVCAIALAASLTASADFSYSRTQKVTGGSMGAMAGTGADRTSKSYFKGQKSADISSDITTIIDFGAQTITTINHAQKNYKIVKMGDAVAGAAGVKADLAVDVKPTGQKKMVNGFNASETVITMNTSLEMGRGQSMQLQMEISVWTSTEVPGGEEMRAFYKKNAANMPWAAMMGAGGNQSIQKAIADVQKKLTELEGTPVEEIIHVKPAGGTQMAMPAMPQMSAAQQAQMQAAMAKMQEMAKQPGPAGAAAQAQLSKMGPMMGGGAAAGSSPSLIDLTIDSTGFSGAAVPDSVFAIPDGYKQLP